MDLINIEQELYSISVAIKNIDAKTSPDFASKLLNVLGDISQNLKRTADALDKTNELLKEPIETIETID